MADEQKSSPVDFFASLNGVEVILVDLVAQEFEARGFITMIWKDPEIQTKVQGLPSGDVQGLPSGDGKYHNNYKLPDDGFIMPLNPDSLFSNAIESEQISSGIAYHSASGTVAYSINWSGRFAQSMQLSRFPFERIHCEFILKNQRKHFIMRTDKPNWLSEEKLEVWDVQTDLLSLKLSPRVAEEYHLDSLEAVIFADAPTGEAQKSSDQKVLSKPRLIAKLQRIPNYYLWTILFPCFIFGGIICVSFLESLGALNDRLAMSTTMLLTVVALKLVTNDSLPKMNYMNWLDYYYIGAFLFIVSVMLVNVLAAEVALHTDDPDLQVDFDWKMLWIFMTVWVALHTVILLGIPFKWWSRRWIDVDSQILGSGKNPQRARTLAGQKIPSGQTSSQEKNPGPKPVENVGQSMNTSQSETLVTSVVPDHPQMAWSE